VIAAHRDRAIRDQRRRGFHHPFGIAAIAHEIAEEDEALRATRACSLKACGKGLPVGMDVRKECQQHRGPPALEARAGIWLAV